VTVPDDYGYIHLGKVVSYDAVKNAYYVESVALARINKWGPVPSCVPGLATGDRVVLVAAGTTRDNLIILGRVGEEFPDIGDIPGLIAALALKADAAATTAALALKATTSALTAGLALKADAAATTAALALKADAAATTAALALKADAAATTAALAAHAGTLGLHGGLLPVADRTARDALTGLYDGKIIYRQDRDWVEIYNGSAWRVQGTAICTDATDRDGTTGVTNPVAGQLCFLTADGMTYRYTGSAWTVHGLYRVVQTLGADAASITFSNIPSTLSRLMVSWSARSTAAAINAELRMRVDGVTSASYSSSFVSQNFATLAGIDVPNDVYAPMGILAAASATGGNYSGGIIDFPFWNAPGVALEILWRAHMWDSSATNSAMLRQGGTRFFSGSAHTSLNFFMSSGNIKANSQFIVQGWE
jgi:hypothetical protein